jgi:hypothetical protein
MSGFTSDIDIDCGDRADILALLKHIPAGRVQDGVMKRHATGVHITNIPVDPLTGASTIEHKEAVDRGYIKLDLLNVNLYKMVRDEAHLVHLMSEPDWTLLKDREFVSKMIHIHGHYDTIQAMPEPVDTIPRLAMLLAIIRPAKRHLIGKSWREVAETVWKNDGDGYTFKKAHSIAYAQLVVLNMNLCVEEPTSFASLE